MLTIQTGSNNSILRTKSEKLNGLDNDNLILISEMRQTVQAQKGLGLAAPQIGKNIQLVVLNINHDHLKEFSDIGGEIKISNVFINPEITLFSKEEIIMEEGCLSLPKIFGYVKRPKQIEVVYQDKNFKKQKSNFGGLMARVIQHEVDHLNGILFIDKIQKL